MHTKQTPPTASDSPEVVADKPKLLLASRSHSNESEGRGMHGCLAINGSIECFFPSPGSFERNGALFAAAPDLLAALRDCLPFVNKLRRMSGGEGDIVAMNARAAIAAATEATK